MKILKLNLLAVGPFTDSSLDLSGGEEGLHVIYGPNEAGKSSSLRAITDFFFGFHSRTADDFVHPYKRLRIGAQLRHSDGTVLELIRRKANQNSLRLSDDITPLAESELGRFLGDVDKNFFDVMFGIDHGRLRSGGAEIVKGEGKTGELLFAAGAGLAGLQEVQSQLQVDIDKLFKATGRSGGIVADIKDFQEKRKSVREAQVSVDTWKRCDRELRSAEKKKLDIDEEIKKKRREQNRLSRIRDAVPSIGHWRKAVGDLGEVRDAPLLAEDFGENSFKVLVEFRNAQRREKDAGKEIDEIADQLKSLSVPEDLLRESDAIDSLRERLGGYRKAMLDRPGLQKERELAERDAKEILRNLGRPPDLSVIEDLRLPADKTILIQNLGSRHDDLIASHKRAHHDCERIQRKIDNAGATLDGIRIPTEASSLEAIVRDIQKEGDLESQLAAVKEELQGLKQDAAVSLSRLPLWPGSLDAVEKLAVPSLTTVDRFGGELNEASRHLESLHGQLRDETDAQGEQESQLRQLELEQKVPTNDELEAMRRLREQGWQLVLRAWQDGQENADEVVAFVQDFAPVRTLPEAYHRSVEESDQIADKLRSDADRVATKIRLQRDVEQRLVRHKEVNDEIDKADSELRKIEERWCAIWMPLGITPLTPQEMRDWLHQHKEISQDAEGIRAKEREASRLQQQIESQCIRLRLVLKQAELECEHSNISLRELLQLASDRCEEIKAANSHFQQIKNSLELDQSDLANAVSQLDDAKADLSHWQSNWAAEMQHLGLEHDAIPSQANSVLAEITKLCAKNKEAGDFHMRTEGIDGEARDFKDDVAALAKRVLPQLANKSVEEAVGGLTAQHKDALDAEKKRDSLDIRLKEQQQILDDAEALASKHQASLDEMCRLAGCEEYDQLSEMAERSKQRRAREKSVDILEEQLIGLGGGATLESFVSEFETEATDVDSLQPRIDELEDQIERLNGERDERLGEIERAKSELQKIDGSALAAEQAAACESIAARLEDRVQELAVLRVASAVLHAGIEEHRSKNQGPVLSRASEIFRQITLGAFEELRADFNDQGEPVLTGVRSGSAEAILVSGMSDGTCDQLYLALRLASMETWLDRHEPIPFIVDDVLLNFDDDRAVAGLKVLAELSHRTQVIFFTHHQHLAEMAKNNLPAQDVFSHIVG
jgi:uncharacterized protein YhaN